MRTLIAFRLRGRFAHFLRAEAGVNAFSYPVPSRTVILGLLGAVLGLEKDSPQKKLKPMKVALTGLLPVKHWHRAKLRKDSPELLPYEIKNTQSSEKNTKPESATLINQEWLFNPDYMLWVNVPEPYHSELEMRIQRKHWFFQPFLGLSEMLADLEYVETLAYEKLPAGNYFIDSVMRQDQIELDINQVYGDNPLSLHMLRMPRMLSETRVFRHASYILEKDALPVPVRTSEAYKVGGKVLMFL